MDDKTNAGRPKGVVSPVRISLCLLTWNEIEGCKHDVPRLPINEFDEVFAVDGGSTDGTIEYLQSCGITVHRQPKPGYNQANIHAFRTCTTDALVLFHPKGSVDPAVLVNFRPLFQDMNDLVIASRIVKGSRNEEDDKLWRPRKWFVFWLGLLAALIWRRNGPWIRDVLHGFRGMRRDRFFQIEPLEAGLSIDLEMVVRCYRKDLRMVEFPVEEHHRLSGDTHFSAFPTGKHLVSYMIQELKRFN
jgi:glycosyltransferase involved in cell wall biosynthesis